MIGTWLDRTTPQLRRFLMVAAGSLVVAGCGDPDSESAPRLALVEARDITVAIAAGVVEPVTMVEVKSRASGEIVQVWRAARLDPIRALRYEGAPGRSGL